MFVIADRVSFVIQYIGPSVAPSDIKFKTNVAEFFIIRTGQCGHFCHACATRCGAFALDFFMFVRPSSDFSCWHLVFPLVKGQVGVRVQSDKITGICHRHIRQIRTIAKFHLVLRGICNICRATDTVFCLGYVQDTFVYQAFLIPFDFFFFLCLRLDRSLSHSAPASSAHCLQQYRG